MAEGRHYSVAQQRAQEILSHQSPITIDDIYYVLSALPQPKNTRRVGVIPHGKNFVHSQAAGLTTQHGLNAPFLLYFHVYFIGARPTLSSICLKCPLVVTVLSKFVLEYDPNFTFTTITINYNYAAAPHHDVNHEDGRARIIALGDFEGGELNIEGIGDINIRNEWYDFDGTILHSTKPFIGERYSLVYFTHISWKLDGGLEVGKKLINLGVPWPEKISNCSPGSIQECSISSQQCSYFFLPLKKRHQYENAFPSELLSLSSLFLPCSSYSLLPPVHELYKNNIEEQTIRAYGLLSAFDLLDECNSIADRAVTFTVWKRVCSSHSLESLFQAQVNAGWSVPHKFGIEIYSPGKHLSTRQKRKVLLLAQLSRPSCPEMISDSKKSHTQLGLLLEYDWSHKDEDGSDGILRYVHLCEQIRPQSERFEKERRGCNNEMQFESQSGPTNIISSTALKHSLSQILCNLALITSHSLIYDPFCGSGSILRVAQQLGGYCIGSDAFEQHLNLDSDKDQELPNIFISNIYHCQLNLRGQFDAIICDPPYGRREKHVNENGIDYASHQTNDERALAQFKILSPLIKLSSNALKVGGRLVFLFLKYVYLENSTVITIL